MCHIVSTTAENDINLTKVIQRRCQDGRTILPRQLQQH